MGTRLLLVLLAVLLAVPAAGCGRARPKAEPAATGPADIGAFEEEPLSGKIRADGSSTVAPLVSLAAERFRKEEPDVQVTVGISGTGGGFERFCRGETDISNASRAIEDDEKALCEKKGIDFIELQVANDGLSVVVNPDNTWASCLTVDQLKRIWQPGSKVSTWKAVDDQFPDDELTLYGPGTDSGTFDYFTDAIVGEEGASRGDYTASEDDNVIVRGVGGRQGRARVPRPLVPRVEQEGVEGGRDRRRRRLRRAEHETVQDGTYKPLSRPLFVYIKTSSLGRIEVETFAAYLLDNADGLARGALFVPLTPDQLDEAYSVLDGAAAGG